MPPPGCGAGTYNADGTVRDPETETPAEETAIAWRALSTTRLEPPVTFGFECYNTRFDAALVPNGDGGAKLSVSGKLGVLPFSAESLVARNYIKAVVQAGHDLPYAEISLSSKQAITACGEMAFPTPPPTAIVVASVSVIVVALKPFIDMITFFRSAGTAVN